LKHEGGLIVLKEPEHLLFSFPSREVARVERQSDGAISMLRMLIVTMALEPGSLIDEPVLAQRIGFGRTPLREAIYRLADERLVIILPRRSVIVAPISINDLQQIFEARIALECAAARLAAERIKPGQLTALQERERSLAELSESTDTDVFARWADCHFEFHYLLAQACANEYLFDGIRSLLPTSLRLNFFLFRHGAMATDRANNHAAIVAALQDGDCDAADAALQRHISGAKDRILRLL
jgi:DNA-binding GntR family transcriptional regulator